MSEEVGRWNIVGHAWAVQSLQRALASGRLSHATLFLGPPHVGKRTLALELARAIQCSAPQPPCGTCRSCQLASRDVHPDIETVRGAGSKGDILVDQIRELRRSASLAPVEGRRRIYILCGMEFANPSASNALLKILEEPPAHVVFLLTATASELLAPTIVSRCQVLTLRPEPRETIRRALCERWDVPADEADLLARLSGGRLGVALALWRSAPLRARRRQAVETLQELLTANAAVRFQFVRRALRRADELTGTLETWSTWWRDIVLLQQGLGEQITNEDYRPALTAWGTALDLDQAAGALHDLQACADQLQRNVNARLALERLMLVLPQVVSP